MKKLYTISLMVCLASLLSLQGQASLFFSEYAEGGANRKALEIYNPTASAVDLADYQIAQSVNGGGWQYYHEFPASASIAAGDVWVIITNDDFTGYFDGTADEILAYPSVAHHNGDDARAIVYITATDTTILDIIGIPDEDPGSGWEVAGISNGTQNHTLVRKPNVTAGTDDWAASAGTDAATSQWMVWDQDDFSNLSIAPAAVSSISIAGEGDVSTIDVDDGTLQIIATISPADASVQSPEWSIDDESLASIDENGLLTALENGDVIVTATVSDGVSTVNGTLSVSISNQVSFVPVTSITVTGTGDATTITDPNATLQMLAAVEPAEATDPTLTWSVNDSKIATISESGLLTAWSNGVVTVTASANDASGVTGTADITISGQSVEMQPLFFSEYIEGGSNRKALEIFNPTESAVNLAFYEIAQSNNGSGWLYYHQFPSGATIAAGDVWTIITNDDMSSVGFDPSNADEVLAYPSVTHHNGDDARAIIYITSEDTTITDVIGIPDEDPGSGWEVAGVSNGTQNHTLVRKEHIETGTDDWAASAGTDSLSSQWLVYDQDEFSYLGSHTMVPFVAITSITLSGEGDATTIDTQGGTLQINAAILPAEATNTKLDWSVDDALLASIDENGLLLAINDGDVLVTATATDGSEVTGTITITISNQNPVTPVTAITVTGTGDATTITENGGTLQMLAEVTPADATDATYAWSADDDAVATIDVNGLLTATGNGTVNVTATANDGFGAEGSLEITVSGQYVEVADLTALRAMDHSDKTTVYKVAGEVVLTFQQDYRGKKYLQDAGAGIEIDDDPGVITTTYSIGDGISGLMGTLNDYYGHLQFVPNADPGAASSTGNAITPLVLTTTQILADHEPYQSMVIKLENVVFPEADGSLAFANGDSYELGDANDTIFCKVHFYDSGVDGTTVPDSANVTGILVYDWSNPRIAPRSTNDIEELTIYVPSDDASITDLLVDGVSIPGFSPAVRSYTMELPSGSTDVPDVTVVTSNDAATVDETKAVNLDGTEEERTTTVVITSEDESATSTYTVTFSLMTGVDDLSAAAVSIFPVPAQENLNVVYPAGITQARIVSVTGASVKLWKLNGEQEVQLDISELNDGIYFLKIQGEDSTEILRFIKK